MSYPGLFGVPELRRTPQPSMRRCVFVKATVVATKLALTSLPFATLPFALSSSSLSVALCMMRFVLWVGAAIC